MTGKIVKYNPSFLTDQELIESFVVRQDMLALVLEIIRENTQQSNQHLLVLGPRGSGKTTLLRRVAAAVHQDPELDALWFPLPYGEESYEVASAGQFWLEALYHLQTRTEDPKWGQAYEELLLEPDEKRLEQRCLARLLDFADSCGKRILLLVENLNLMLDDQLSEDDGWALRETLMHESRIMLLGSATSRFDAITDSRQPMFELFHLLELARLSVGECREVWRHVAGKEITEPQARAVQILTGGNPRLLTILALFGAQRSFRSLLEDLSLLVDEHTDYFKSNFENLPPAERKIFACLAALWEDSPASAVATAARMTTNKASALLKRLEGRGAVQVAALQGKKKRYQLAERLYNVYYLMRRGQTAGRVQAVVHFMVQYYGPERLHECAADIANEACGLEKGQRVDHYRALQMLYERAEDANSRKRICGALPSGFAQLPDLPENLRCILLDEKRTSLPARTPKQNEAIKAVKERRWEDAARILRNIIQHDPADAWAWATLGGVLADTFNQPEESASCLRKAVELDPKLDWAWANLGGVLTYKLNQPEKSASCLRKAVELDPKLAKAWAKLGLILADKLDQPEEGASCLRKAVELDPKLAREWANLGIALAYQLDHPEEGASCLQKAVELDPKLDWAWANLGLILADKLDHPEEGASCLQKAVKLDPKLDWAWANLGLILADKLDQPEEGASCLRKAVELDPKLDWEWANLGITLAYQLDQPEEGASCLQKAVELDPKLDWAWANLGGVLANKLNQPEEGVTCLRKAVELDPNDAWAWAMLGGVFAEALDQPEEGASCLRKAVELDPNDAWAWALLGAICIFEIQELTDGFRHLNKAATIDTACLTSFYFHKKLRLVPMPMTTFEAILECTNRPVGLLNAMACALIDTKNFEQLDTIEHWAREAVEKAGDKPLYHGTLSRALALRGAISEALKHAGVVLQHPDVVRKDIQESTDVMAIAAALGHGQEALDMLQASPSLPELEPLAAGLKLYLGLDLRAPQEVREIGEDIVLRIEEWKQWHEARRTADQKIKNI